MQKTYIDKHTRLFQSFLKLDELHSELQGHEMKSEVDSDTLATTQIPMGTKVALPLTVCEDNSFISIECVTATWDKVNLFLTERDIHFTLIQPRHGSCTKINYSCCNGHEIIFLALDLQTANYFFNKSQI